MLYMSGNSVQIFSILITVMLFFNSIKAILSVNQTFESLGFVDKSSSSSTTNSGTSSTTTSNTGTLNSLLSFTSSPYFLPKLTFMAVQSGNLALGIWKCGSMGLLPTAQSDWLAFLEPKVFQEESFTNAF